MLRVLEDFGTGYVHTTVLHTDDGYVWIRRPGPDRPTPLRQPNPVLRAIVDTITAPVLPLLCDPPSGSAPDVAPSWAVFHPQGPDSLAKLFLQPESDSTETAAAALLGTGTMLAELHRRAVPEAVRPPTPNGPARLLRWLRGGGGPRAGGRVHRDAVRLLGLARIRTIQEWCTEFGADGTLPTGRHVLLHGAPSHGVLIPAAPSSTGASAVMLIGEETAWGPAEFDLGWLVGELLEYRDLPNRTGHGSLQQLDYQRLIDRLLAGYGAPLALDAVGRCAVLRLFTHIHDFSAYVGWHDHATAYLEAVVEMTDAAAHDSLLDGGTRPAATVEDQ